MGRELGVVPDLGLGRWDVAYGLEQPAMTEQVHPFERGKLNGLEGSLLSAPVDCLSLLKAFNGLCQCVFMAAADATDLRLDPGHRGELGVLSRNILAATIAVMSLAVLVGIPNRSVVFTMASRTILVITGAVDIAPAAFLSQFLADADDLIWLGEMPRSMRSASQFLVGLSAIG